MVTLVIYDTKFGNTEKIARAIARGAATVGEVLVMDTTEAAGPPAGRPDLLIIGGPTQNLGLSPALKGFLQALPSSLKGIPTASFDTRYRAPALLTGSAAADTAKRLRRAGGRSVAPPESFFIARGGKAAGQVLEPDELERAEEWGRAVTAALVSGRASRVTLR